MLHKVNNRAVEGLNTLSFNKAQKKSGHAIPYKYVFMVKLAIEIGICNFEKYQNVGGKQLSSLSVAASVCLQWS
jgi:hypothetical protein